MLQFIVKSDNPEEIISQTREALEGGCRWIELKTTKAISDEELTEVINKLMPVVKEKEGTLTLASRVTLAKQTGVDGVQLYLDDMPPTAARMELEAGPIIGMSVRDLDTVERNLHFDIDYFRYEPLFEEDGENLKTLLEIARLLKEKKSDKPLAAAGGLTSENVEVALEYGAEGVAIDASYAEEGESVKNAVASLIELLGKS